MSARKRNPNFSQNEKTIVLQFVLDDKEIIENKKTDAATWKAKENAWLRIGEKFNSQSTECFRSTESLKRFYNNLKVEIRKEIATGRSASGNKSFTLDPNFELICKLMDLQDEFDGDSAMQVNESGEGQETINNDCSSYRSSSSQKFNTPDHISCGLVFKEEPDTLSPASSSKSAPKQFDNNESTEQTTQWAIRRKPLGSSLQRRNISAQYSRLSKIKIELAKLQYDTLKKESLAKTVEYDLKRKSLELDIAIKNELLKKIRKEDCAPKDAKSILRDIEIYLRK